MEEVSFMVKYVWLTLLLLYNRLKLGKRLRFRNIYKDRTIEITGEQANFLKLFFVIQIIYETVIQILRKLQQIFLETIEISKHGIKGKIMFNMFYKYYPQAVPVKKTFLTVDTLPNRLLLITIVEIKSEITKLKKYLIEHKYSPIMEPFRDYLISKIDTSINLLDRIIHDPVLKPLLSVVKKYIGKKEKILELEREVKSDILTKRRELNAYQRILDLREGIKKPLIFIKKGIKNGDIEKLLTLDITKDKLYELFCFALILESVLERFNVNENWDVDIDTDGKVLTLLDGYESVEIKIAYNSELKSSVSSRLKKAKAFGILKDGLDASKLGGLPDTIILFGRGRGVKRVIKRVIIDYKFTRDFSYLSLSRAKALAYLYEFRADVSILIVTPPKKHGDVFSKDDTIELRDDEAEDQASFYSAAINRGGAIVSIDNDDKKLLVIAFIEPKKDEMKNNKKILEKILDIILNLFIK